MNKTTKILAMLGFALALGGTTVSRADVPPPDAGEDDAATATDAATEDDASTDDDASTPSEDAATPAEDASTAADSGATTPPAEDDGGCSVGGSASQASFGWVALALGAIVLRRRNA